MGLSPGNRICRPTSRPEQRILLLRLVCFPTLKFLNLNQNIHQTQKQLYPIKHIHYPMHNTANKSSQFYLNSSNVVNLFFNFKN